MPNDRIHLCPEEQCTGCAACAGVCGKNAISFTENSEGFLYPQIDYTICVSCTLCQKTCPVLHPVSIRNNGVCYAAWSKDINIRTHSSSGGLFSEFARNIISQGGIVVGASLDDTTGIVHHIAIDNITDLYKIQGSKYVQSVITADILKLIKRSLRNGQKVLFTGTPCQTAGVISLTKNPDNLYTLDVVCHGVPSPKWFKKIHDSIRHRIDEFVNYNFRKLSEWCVCANINVKTNGIVKNKELRGPETCYQDAFLKGYLHRENCYQCNYANTARVSDITVADFWGIGSKNPIIDDHKLGCSMLLVNSEKGEQMFADIRNYIYAEPRDVSETIEAGNEQLLRPSSRPSERDSFYTDAYRLPLSKLIRKYGLNYVRVPSLASRIKSKIKSILFK